MLARALTLCTALFLKESFGSVRKYNDFFFNTTFNGSNLTWMMMPNDNGVIVSALLAGVTPEQDVTPEQVEFILWTRETRENPEKHIYNNETSNPVYFVTFKASKPTVILIHGFTDTMKEPEFFNTLVPAFLKQDDYNIIGVNWRNLASLPWYGEAVKNSFFVGYLTAHMINALQSQMQNREIHIVAHNLGTLVAGVAAAHTDRIKIGRITGLDPSHILTSELPNSKKLDKGDADLVEIIHTSGDYIGINSPAGHRDFYPNNGKWPQPGCTYDIADRCSPRRAYYYYAESVSNSTAYIGTRCSDYENYLRGACWGEKTLSIFNSAPSRIQGKFYLHIKPGIPYPW